MAASLPYQGGTEHHIRTFVVHPGFAVNPIKDLAILQLETPIALDDKTKWPIPMFEAEEKIEIRSTAVNPAWNVYFTEGRNGRIWTPRLKSAEFKVVNKNKCLKFAKVDRTSTVLVDDFFKSHICTKKTGNLKCTGTTGVHSSLVANLQDSGPAEMTTFAIQSLKSSPFLLT